jgi:hypothetical protein
MMLWQSESIKPEALSVQEPTGKPRAEIGEIWGWLKRSNIF